MTIWRRCLLVVCGLTLLVSCSSTPSSDSSGGDPAGAPGGSPPRTAAGPPGTVASVDPAKAAAVDEVITDAMARQHLRSVIVRVTVDGEEILTKAYGESMTGVPATTDMHFRNGAVAIAYMANLTLQLADDGELSLDDRISTWVPDIPHSEQVTVGQLLQMTSGYPDFVIGNQEFGAQFYADPFRQWTSEEQLALVTSEPLIYPPGTNWNYAHTNYVILGLVIEAVTGQSMEAAMQEMVLGPLGLADTSGNGGTPAIPAPALHSFSAERKGALSMPDDAPFFEETTFWNPSWTLAQGAIQTTTIHDLDRTAYAIGDGELLTPESHAKVVSRELIGKTTAVDGCATCRTSDDQYAFGLGVVLTGDWMAQTPLFAGQGGAFAFLPSERVAISVAVTMAEDAFEPDGSYKPEVEGNAADSLWRQIGAVMAPDDAPPPRKSG